MGGFSPNMAPATLKNPEKCIDADKNIGVRIGCVPEHFSAPLYLSLEENAINSNVIFQLYNCPGGTGEMINLLNDAKIDVAITLTEGTVLRACKDLLENTPNPLQIIGSYTQSTLNWAVATAKDSCFKSKYDLRNTKVGISRYGSGSHIMAVVFAFQSGWITKEGIGFEFVLLDNIEGLLRGIETGEIDVFLWEMITTKPYEDAGLLRIIDSVVPPWPAFVISSKTYPKATELCTNIAKSFSYFENHFRDKGMPLILNRKDVFHYEKEEDIQSWFSTVRFSTNPNIVSRTKLAQCIENLIESKLLDKVQFEQWEQNSKRLIIDSICHESIQFEE